MRIKNTAIKSCVRSYLGGQDHFHSVKGNCQIVAIQDWIYKGTIRHSVENHPRKNVKILYTNTLLCETCKSANFLIFWSMHKFSHSEFQKHDFHICIQQMNQIKYQAGRQLALPRLESCTSSTCKSLMDLKSSFGAQNTLHTIICHFHITIYSFILLHMSRKS